MQRVDAKPLGESALRGVAGPSHLHLHIRSMTYSFDEMPHASQMWRSAAGERL